MTVTANERTLRAAELARRAWAEALSDRARRTGPDLAPVATDEAEVVGSDDEMALSADGEDEAEVASAEAVQAEVRAMLANSLDDEVEDLAA